MSFAGIRRLIRHPHLTSRGHRAVQLPTAVCGVPPQRRPRQQLDRRLEAVAKAVGSGYCRLQMPLKPALAVRGTVAGRRLGTLFGGRGGMFATHCAVVYVLHSQSALVERILRLLLTTPPPNTRCTISPFPMLRADHPLCSIQQALLGLLLPTCQTFAGVLSARCVGGCPQIITGPNCIEGLYCLGLDKG